MQKEVQMKDLMKWEARRNNELCWREGSVKKG